MIDRKNSYYGRKEYSGVRVGHPEFFSCMLKVYDWEIRGRGERINRKGGFLETSVVSVPLEEGTSSRVVVGQRICAGIFRLR